MKERIENLKNDLRTKACELGVLERRGGSDQEIYDKKLEMWHELQELFALVDIEEYAQLSYELEEIRG